MMGARAGCGGLPEAAGASCSACMTAGVVVVCGKSLRVLLASSYDVLAGVRLFFVTLLLMNAQRAVSLSR